MDMAIRNTFPPIGIAASLTTVMVAVRSRVYDVFEINIKVDNKEPGRRAVATTEGLIQIRYCDE